MARKLNFNETQSQEAGKYFLDLSKVTFTALVIGSLVSDKLLVLHSIVWYAGVVITTLTFVGAMYLLRTKRK
jgi:hypothetical protein